MLINCKGLIGNRFQLSQMIAQAMLVSAWTALGARAETPFFTPVFLTSFAKVLRKSIVDRIHYIRHTDIQRLRDCRRSSPGICAGSCTERWAPGISDNCLPVFALIKIMCRKNDTGGHSHNRATQAINRSITTNTWAIGKGKAVLPHH
jgi:hypothetical protein